MSRSGAGQSVVKRGIRALPLLSLCTLFCHVSSEALSRDAAEAPELGKCFILDGGAVLTPLGMSFDRFLSFAPRPADVIEPQYEFKDRWTSTATDGSVGSLSPMTLTYSFVPDGTMIEGARFAGDPDSPSELFALLDANFPGGRAAWQAAFSSVFERWGELTGITYVEVSDDGAGNDSSPGARPENRSFVPEYPDQRIS